MSDKKYWNEMLSHIKNMTVIEAVGATDDEGNVWPVIVLADSANNVFQLEISSDEEGNGPGHIYFSKLFGENFENSKDIRKPSDWN